VRTIAAVNARLTRIVLVLLLVAYGRWLSPAVAPLAGSADSSGYLWSARLFRSGAIAEPIAPAGLPLDVLGPAVFAPLGATVRPGTGAIVPTYPTGLPLHLAAAGLVLAEERAVRVVLLGAAAAALWLAYRLGREAGLARPWAAAGAAWLASSPLFLLLAVQPMSDVLATAWVEAAILFAWRSRRRTRDALAAGSALGIAVLVRPTNLVAAVAIAAAMPWTRRHLRWCAAGLLPPALFLATYQTVAYGHPLASGYGDVTTAFSWAHVGPSLRHYAQWIPVLFSPLVLAAPLAWRAWRGELAPWRRITIAWAAVFFGTYAFYYHTAETWWYLRFVLPGMPPILIAALAALQHAQRRIAARVPSRRRALASVLAGAACAAVFALAVVRHASGPPFEAYRQVRGDERIYRDALRWMAIQRADDGPVLMVQLSGAANYYAPGLRFLRYDRLTPEGWTSIRRWQRQTGRPVRAALAPFEQDELFGSEGTRFECDWRPQGTYRWVSFWECPAERRR
jgi:hypothetical protein